MATVPTADVKEIQRGLKAIGLYDGPIDGIWGPKTKAGDLEAIRIAGGATQPAPAKAAVDWRTAMEIAHHEAVIRQAYRDSVGKWTWSVGLTSNTGHNVERYIDNPQSLQHCLNIYVWALRNYARQVDLVFSDTRLMPEAYAGALSFHWNTGRLRSASWVDHYKAGEHAKAEASFKRYNKAGGKISPALVDRRAAEADLIWRGVWAGTGKMLEYTRVTATHRPDWKSGVWIEVGTEMLIAFGAMVKPVLDARPKPLAIPAAPTLTAETEGESDA